MMLPGPTSPGRAAAAERSTAALDLLYAQIRQRATFDTFLRQVPTSLPPTIYAACTARRGERLGPVSALSMQNRIICTRSRQPFKAPAQRAESAGAIHGRPQD
jgi:hypothetical protein